MPRYEIENGGKRYIIEGAGDMQSAISAVKKMAGGSQGPSMPGAGGAEPNAAPGQRIAGAFQAASEAPDTRIAPSSYGVQDYVTGNLPFGTDALAALGAIGPAITGRKSFGQAFQEKRALEKRAQQEYAMDHPLRALGGKALSIAVLSPAAAASVPATLGGRIAQSAATGAGIGAAYGGSEGSTVGERLQNAATGAAGGAVTGAAFPALGTGIARLAGRRPPQAGPSLDDLRTAADSLYSQADNAGVVIGERPFARMVNNIGQAARRAGIDGAIHPKASAALQRMMDDIGDTPTLREMDTLRRVLRGAAASLEPDERRIAQVMIDSFDRQLSRMGQRDVIAGDVRAATNALTEARGLWSRMRKGEAIETLFERARNAVGANYTAAGMQTALRQQFRQLANNPKQMRQFTQAEQNAIRRVVRGGPLENAMRLLSKFAPHGIVSTTLAGGAGYAAGGPVGAAALMGAGELGRRAGAAMTMNAAERVGAMARNGGRLPAPPPLSPGQIGRANFGQFLRNEAVGNSAPYSDRRNRASLAR